MARPPWLRWADALRSIARAGLTYSRDPFDRERFAQVEAVAMEILDRHADVVASGAAEVMRSERGYVTPKVDVRAVVFDGAGRLLLVREVSDGRWSLPGGWADLGESAAEVAVREVREESGLEVRATQLVALLDKAKHDHPVQPWYVYKAFFRCDLVGGALSRSAETPEAGWFEEGALPPLSTDRVTAAQLAMVFRHRDAPDLPAAFD